MKFQLSKKKFQTCIMCIPLVCFSTLASLNKFVSSLFLFAMVLLIWAGILKKMYRKSFVFNKYIFWILGMLIVYAYKNPNFIPNSFTYMQYFLLFPACILFAFQGGYIDSRWMNIVMKMLKFMYLIYILFTILMFMSSTVLQMVCKIFPEAAETIIKQYNSSGMPGLTTHYSTNGMLLSVGTILLGSKALAEKKLVNNFLFIISIVALLLSGKRAHVIFGLLALYLAYYVYNTNKKKNRLVKSIGILLVAGSLFVIASYFIPALANVVIRFVDTADAGDISVGRVDVWLKALNSIKGHFLVGIGWGQYVNQGGWLWNIHNIYIQLLVETGIVGLLLYLGWFIYNLVKTWQGYIYIRKNLFYYTKSDIVLINFSLAMQILFILYGFTGNPLYDREMFVPYFIACAISVYYCNQKIKT